MFIAHELAVNDVNLCARKCYQTRHSLNQVLRQRTHGYKAVSHHKAAFPHHNYSVHVFLDVEIHQSLGIGFLSILESELFLDCLELFHKVKAGVCEQNTLDNHMMMRVIHLDLDNGPFISEEIDGLIFVARFNFYSRLSHHNIASVDALTQFDNGSFFCCFNSFSYSPVLSKLRVNNDFFGIFDFRRPTSRYSIPCTVWPDTCYALSQFKHEC
jgi:hypothetical protein